MEFQERRDALKDNFRKHYENVGQSRECVVTFARGSGFFRRFRS